jgi:predicted aspartyl protease
MDAEVFHVVSKRSSRLRAKLDSGADATAIPERVVKELRLVPTGEQTFRGWDGKRSKRPTYVIDLSLNGMKFDWIEVTSAKRADLLVGRDILNRLRLVLDGKNQSFEVEDP